MLSGVSLNVVFDVFTFQVRTPKLYALTFKLYALFTNEPPSNRPHRFFIHDGFCGV